MERELPVFGTIKASIRDGFRATWALPGQALVYVALGLIVGFAKLLTAGILYIPLYSPLAPPIELLFAHLFDSPFQLLDMLLAVPWAIIVHRFVLLGEVTRSYPLVPNGRYLRYCANSLVMLVVWMVPVLLGFSGIGAILALGALALTAFTTILFPAIAIDSPNANWDNSFSDSKGHFWSIILILAIFVLPCGVVLGVLLFGLRLVSPLAAVIVPAFVGPIGLAISAALGSHIYRRLAVRTARRPAAPRVSRQPARRDVQG